MKPPSKVSTTPYRPVTREGGGAGAGGGGGVGRPLPAPAPDDPDGPAAGATVLGWTVERGESPGTTGAVTVGSAREGVGDGRSGSGTVAGGGPGWASR
jgi:hypothetical protein